MSEPGALAPADIIVVQPGEEESLWQPVPANGHISVLLSPDRVAMRHRLAMGTQTLPPGGYVREHAHVAQEEAFYFLSGSGKAVVNGVTHPCRPGTTIFLGSNQWHTFVNDSDGPMVWLWLIVPHGLEGFFRAIGRPRTEGQPAPEPFARPAEVTDIERNWGFAAPRGAATGPAKT